MKTSHVLATALITICLLTAGLTATARAGQTTGDNALQLSGNLTHTEGADSGVLNLVLDYGHLLTDSLEVGLQQTLAYSFIDGADDQWVASTIPFINFYFNALSKSDAFLPFVGAFIGASYNEDDTTGTVGPQLGFRSFVNDRTFLLVKYRYEWFFDELTVNDIDDTKSDGNHVVTIGVGFIF